MDVLYVLVVAYSVAIAQSVPPFSVAAPQRDHDDTTMSGESAGEVLVLQMNCSVPVVTPPIRPRHSSAAVNDAMDFGSRNNGQDRSDSQPPKHYVD